MLRIQFRNDHRHIGRAAMRRVIGNDGRFALGICVFQRANLVLLHIDGAENKIHFACYAAYVRRIADNQRAHSGGNIPVKCPASADRFLVSLACASRGGGDDRNLKPRVIGKQGNKTLTHHARCANNCNTPFTLHDESILSTLAVYTAALRAKTVYSSYHPAYRLVNPACFFLHGGRECVDRPDKKYAAAIGIVTCGFSFSSVCDKIVA